MSWHSTRTTFTPDHVAARALNGRALELVIFYHDGRQITDQPREAMAQLMEITVGMT